MAMRALQNILDTAEVPVEHWFLPIGVGIGFVILDEARKYCVRMWPKGVLARMAWYSRVRRGPALVSLSCICVRHALLGFEVQYMNKCATPVPFRSTWC